METPRALTEDEMRSLIAQYEKDTPASEVGLRTLLTLQAILEELVFLRQRLTSNPPDPEA
jgi:hypothetical protein